jgi:hypothetical protein
MMQKSEPLIDLVRPGDTDGPLVSAILSTYGLSLEQPPFFEQDFLPSLLGLGGIRDRGYAAPLSLERKLGECYCAILADAHALADAPRPSLRVDVLPIGNRTNHAKVVLLHRTSRIRLIVTSANLTHAGYRRQREICVVLDFREGGPLAPDILTDALKSWEHVLGSAVSPPLRRALIDAADQARHWTRGRNAKNRLLSVAFGGAESPLWRQLVDAWPVGEPVLEWYVCSPTWPEPSGGQTPFEAIAAGLEKKSADLTACALLVLTCADTPGAEGRPCFPVELLERLRSRRFPVRRGRIIPVRLDALPLEVPETAAECNRELHAKWVLLRGPRTAVALVGSANFTRKGLGVLRDPTRANIEACVLMRGSPSDLKPADWQPPIADKGIVNWETVTGASLATPPAEDDEKIEWPAFLARIDVEVLWQSGAEPAGLMQVILCGDAPAFEIHKMGPDGKPVAPRLFARSSVSPEPEPVSLGPEEVTALLARRSVYVKWGSPPQSCAFPVNIDEDSKAGLPSVLGMRPEETELLAYFHGRISEDDLVRLLEERSARPPGPPGQEVSPEEARELQSYVMRPFVESLFGMREILRSSLGSPRAFQQALVGDFSPTAVAERALQACQSGRRSPTAAAFQFSELLRVITTLDLSGRDNVVQLKAVRQTGLDRMLAIIRTAASSPSFRTACQDKAFRAYIETSLSSQVARQWWRVLE